MAHSISVFRRSLLTFVPLALLTGVLSVTPAPAAGQDPAEPEPIPEPGPEPAPEPGPDDEVAYIQLVVEASETTASGTASAARLRARTVVGALEASGVTTEEIEQGEVEMTSILERPRVGSSRRPAPPQRVIGYRAWIPITIATPALARVDFLIGRAAGAGAYLEWVDYGERGEERVGVPIGE